MWALTILLVACSSEIIWAQSSPSCILEGGGLGGCVETEQCDPNTNTIIEDGSNIINARNDGDVIKCPQPQVCCAYMRSEMRSAATEENRCTNSSTCCGVQRRVDVSGYVKQRTNEADPGEFPWVVDLMMRSIDKVYQYAGTGSLIHTRVVLTAAHIVYGKDTNLLLVITGDHDQEKAVMKKKGKVVTEVVIHPQFNRGNGDYNYALAFLRKSALADGLPHVGTVCLPPAGYVPTAGTRCVFSGWGVDSNLINQQQLVKTVVPMMAHGACEQRLQQDPSLGPGFRLLDSLTCAGGEVGRDICGGGGGSPLVCPMEDYPERYVQIGIVTWVTSGCGINGSPTVFADVSKVRSWIDQQLANRSFYIN
ncbi:phenoloxidase-activating factor 2-like [Ostrinia nubilalis]|uniref:phenoloxidase-activating factor 2-like n=1 Tax=Ostrinia nubilalis TaxID=29057 RepID=UPI0030822BA6